MALRDAFSFDDSTVTSHRWQAFAGTINAGSARTGARGIQQIPQFGVSSGCCRTFDAQPTWIIGRGWRVDTLAGGLNIMGTVDLSTITMQGTLAFQSGSGFMQLLRGGVTVVATSTLNIMAGIYNYVELKHTIANSGGTLEGRVNGVVWATFTGDTQQSANAFADQVGIGGDFPVDDTDDVYFCDGIGPAPWNDYLGEQAIYYLPCNADGDLEEWTPSAGSNFQNVDELDPDADTTYNGTDVENEIDLFNVADLPIASGVVNGMVILIRARKETAGTANIQRVHKRAGTTSTGASFNPGTTYGTIAEVLVNDPVSATQLTISNINDMQLGYKAVA